MNLLKKKKLLKKKLLSKKTDTTNSENNNSTTNIPEKKILTRSLQMSDFKKALQQVRPSSEKASKFAFQNNQ